MVDNLAFRAGAAQSESAIRDAIAELRLDEHPNHADALRLAEGCACGRLTKFLPCLPPRLESEFLAEVLTDDAAARVAIAVVMLAEQTDLLRKSEHVVEALLVRALRPSEPFRA